MKKGKKIHIEPRKRKILTRILVVVFVVCLAGASVFGYLNTKVNFNMSTYLPQDSETIKGLDKLESDFGSASYARIMLKGLDINNAAAYKKQFAAVEGVNYTMWLDDILNMLTAPLQEDENAQQVIDEIINSLGKIIELPADFMDFIDALKQGNAGEELLNYVNQYPIVLDFVDIIVDYYFMGAIQLTNYFDAENNNALIEVYFEENDYSQSTDRALTEIMEICRQSSGKLTAYFDGSAVAVKASRETTEREALISTLLVLPFILILLLLATTSVYEPVLFILIIGISVLLNMGSNIVFQLLGILDGISFITNSMAMALQMAISMDYSIFLLHRYQQEKSFSPDKGVALKNAVRASVGPLLASCLTTVAGFVALSMMEFCIGLDIGLVFSKGIIISFLCVIFLMPAFIGMFDRLIERHRHRSFIPKTDKISRFCIKGWLPIIVAVCLLGGVGYTLQLNLKFNYGESAISSSEGTRTYEDSQTISDAFGTYNPFLVIIPIQNLRTDTLEDSDPEKIIVDKIKEIEYDGKKIVKSIMAYRAFAKPGMADLLPEVLVANFDSADGKYTRIVCNVAVPTESAAAFYAYEQIVNIIKPYTSDFYVTGSTVAAYDMKRIIEADYTFVNLLAIIAIAVIILVMFRSLLLPLLLLLTIEFGIFINMGIAALAGGEVAFLGYLVVSLIQLGATIDYAILYTKNYTDMRRQYGKKMALEKALAISFPSVLTSAAILSCAGFMVGLTSTVAAVKQIGLMLGRGALISGVLVVLFLPPLLLLFDHYIQKLSLRMHFVKEEKGGELPDDYHDHALEESTSTREEGGDERPEPESEPDVPHS